MRRPTLAGAILVSLIIAGSAAPGAEITLSPGQAARAGIAVAPLRTVRMTPTIAALGTILDPAPLIRLSGEFAAAEAAVAAAEAQVALDDKLSARTAALYHGRLNSALDYEKAQAARGSARIALAAARARRRSLLAQAEATWGPAVAAALGGGALLPPILTGKAMLVGLSLPPGKAVADPPRGIAAVAEAGIRLSLHPIGPLPRMLAGYPGQALLYEAPMQPGAPIGTIVTAALPDGPPRVGVVVPWSAVLWRDGQPLVFRAAAGDRFEPVAIATDFPTAGGYLVSAPQLRSGRIVVRGAALLPGAGGPPSTDEDADTD
jgi:membrane fusion protein, multidrug efflux system